MLVSISLGLALEGLLGAILFRAWADMMGGRYRYPGRGEEFAGVACMYSLFLKVRGGRQAASFPQLCHGPQASGISVRSGMWTESRNNVARQEYAYAILLVSS